MENNSQSRKWNLTINNPQQCNLEHEIIKEILQKFLPQYYCMCDEIATTGTYHTHIFLSSPSPIRFSTLKNRFPTAHIEKVYGSAQENRDYIRKEGHWADTEKAETSVPNTFEEWGELPPERAETDSDHRWIIERMKAGMTVSEMIKASPKLVFRVRELEILRQTLLSEQYAEEHREIEVSYLYGVSGAGKTRSIFARHSGKDICRVTNYRKGKGVSFDGYQNQDVLVFEEFNSQIPIEEMLNYLDVYPLNLPARYSDRVACYTKVYLTSNRPIEEQYISAQQMAPETWRAFLRRIHNIVEFLPDGEILCHKAKEGGLYDPK